MISKRATFLFLLIHAVAAANSNPPSKRWQTLTGKQPAVVARGGFSGLFPESVQFANEIAITTSVNDVVILCNVQLTKDIVGICQPDVRLDNTTTISKIFPNKSATYELNGKNATGWFAFDFTFDQLNGVTAVQNIFSRPDLYDGYFPISTVDDIIGARPPAIWLNIQYHQIYNRHNTSILQYIQNTNLRTVSYISSSEIGFLKEIKAHFLKTKESNKFLFFVFQEKNQTEPTTNQTYQEIMNNLSLIKPYADGIVVPKEYVYPQNDDGYIQSATKEVPDAQKQGFQVYVTGFANDMVKPHNYSYDPSAEYLQYIDNPQFTVDGFITDFPPTASQVVACFAKFNATGKMEQQPLIISHNGASGVYPGSTDLAYRQAVQDGADVVDCSVQMSQDGIAFCLNSADLTGNTDALNKFMSQSVSVPEVQESPGVFSFNLKWSDIQTLTPQIASPFEKFGLERNPEMKNAGSLVTITEFLQIANSAVLVNIENAAYLATKGIDVVTAVASALSNATNDKRVFIQSDDTSVLEKFTNYTRVFLMEEKFGDAPKKTVEIIKKYADAVTLTRGAIVTSTNGFLTKQSKVVEELRAANLSVYVKVFMNEVPTLLFDYFTDPTIELATYTALKVDGVITEYPKTAFRYLSSPCSDLTKNLEYAILPAAEGSLYATVPEEVAAGAPASAPLAALSVGDVVDPPLPDVASAVKESVDKAQAPAPATAVSGAVGRVGSEISVIVMLLCLVFVEL